MLFRYTGIDQAGKARDGVIDATNIDSAISSLQRRGYTVSTIDPVAPTQNSLFDYEITWFEFIKTKDIVIVSRQIATLFEAQVSALRIFRLLAAENENKQLQRVLTQIADDLQAGSSISKALEQHPKVFSPFYISMVRAGEESGTLNKSFNFLADYLDRTYEIVSKVRNALIYPVFVVLTFIVVMVLMLTLVIPRVSEIIIASGGEIPIYTKIVIGLSGFVSSNLVFMLFFVAIAGFFLWRFGQTEIGARAYDEFKLGIPYIGRLYRLLFLARVADNLSTMLASGISMVKALEVSSEVVDNRVFKELLGYTIEEVKAGRAVSDALSEFEEIPSVMTQIIKVGEETGNLDSILETLAKFYRREVNNEVDTLINLIEPAMIVLLGLGVGVLLASVLLPIYNISATI